MSSPVVLDSIIDDIIAAKCVVGCMNRYQAACVMQQAKQLFDQCKDRVAVLDKQPAVSDNEARS